MQATQTVPAAAAVLQFPKSKPETETVTQMELLLILSMRGQLKQLEDQLAADEAAIKARLQAGAEVEPGDHTAELKEHSRRNVAWKEVTCRLARRLKLDADAFCARVLAATKPTKTVSLEIV